jgi:hypothetical protein
MINSVGNGSRSAGNSDFILVAEQKVAGKKFGNARNNTAQDLSYEKLGVLPTSQHARDPIVSASGRLDNSSANDGATMRNTLSSNRKHGKT